MRRPGPNRSGLLGAVLGLLTGACASRAPSTLEPLTQADEDLVLVKTLRIPNSEPWFSRFAQHSWIDYRRGGSWRRIEIVHQTSGIRNEELATWEAFADQRWGRSIRVLEIFGGERAARITAELAAIPSEPHLYRPWPGPNSNTLTDRVLRQTPELWAVLEPNSVGKDHAGWFRAGRTAGGTGLQVETLPLGLQVGAREGVELHLLGVLSLGLRLWPPALILPLLPALGPERRPIVRR